MKILIVITKAEIGGAQIFVLNLARGLKVLGYQVVVAAGPGDFLVKELEKEGIEFYRFKNLKRSYNPFSGLIFNRELKNYVAKNGFDLVHLNSSNALLGLWPLSSLKKKSGKPKIVFTVHGLSLIDGQHKTPRLIKKLYQLFFKLAFKKLDHFVFVSQNNFNFAKKIGLLDAGLFKKASTIYNGLDFPDNYFYTSDKARELLKLKLLGENRELLADNLDTFFSNTSFIYGSIGRLAYPKNYEFLISSFKDLKKDIPEIKLLIIGDGPEKNKYQAMIKAYDLSNNIILLGELKDASRYLKAFNLFVLPSVFEGLSLSLIEANIANVPSLASQVGGNEEIVGTEACYKFNDLDEFITKVKGVYKDDVRDLESNDLEKLKFSAKKMTEEYLKLYLR